MADDAAHGLYHLAGMGAHRGLATQHHRIGTVHHRVGHVIHLGPRWARVYDHALHHLCGDDHGSGLGHAFLHDHLLDHWHLLHGHFHAQVATGHHDGIALTDDIADVLDRFGLLDLGHHAGRAARLLDALLEFEHVLGLAHKGQAYPFHILGEQKVEVLNVLFGKRGQ